MYNVLFPRSKAENDGPQFLWCPDTNAAADPDTNTGFKTRQNYLIDQPTTKGRFKLRIPMFMLFGFMENFLALTGYSYKIELVREADFTTLFKDNDAQEGKLKFNRKIDE